MLYVINPLFYTEIYNESIESFTAERANLSFSKFILGVHRKAQNSAVRGELAGFPLGIDIVTNIVSYGKRFADGNTYPLLKEAYTLSKNQNKSWVAKCQHIGQFILETTNTDPFKATRNNIQNTIKQHYKCHWGTR